jgi:CheY-like chemotaxis protein
MLHNIQAETLMPRILVVDDDPNLRTAVRRMLEPQGYEIEEASDGQDAVRIFRARPADLVLCDLFMPEKDGFEVMRELCEEFAETKLVIMSGGGFDGKVNLLPMAQHYGAAAVLPKPFQQADLLAVIGRVLFGCNRVPGAGQALNPS